MVPILAEPLPPFPREFRAAWVATVDNIDWPSKRGLPASRQRAELDRIFNTAARLNLNALVLQIRPSADALYPSPIEPWSEYLTGRQGVPPSPVWDPLAHAVAEAHRRGMELHVWFNPYRANHPAQKGPLAENHLAKTNPNLVKTYGKYLWMDPGEPAVRERFLAVTRDVIRRYDVDGIHIDDYFYPYQEFDKNRKLIDFPDDDSYARYGRGLSRGDWRRKNVDDMVRDLYRTIKAERKSVKFGISPFGIYRPGIPAGIKAGVDQYGELYADAEKWLKEGWCDYFTPQLYWPVRQTPQAYPTLLRYWLSVNPKGRHLWPGNFTGRTNPKEGNWKPAEVQEQIRITRKMGAGGNVHFSMRAFSGNYNNIAQALRGEEYAEPALVPATPWLGDARPAKTSLVRDGGRFAWVSYDRPFLYARWRKIGGRWIKDVLPGDTRAALEDGDVEVYAVAPVSRNGVMGEPAIWRR